MVARLQVIALALLCGLLGALLPQRVEAGAFAPAPRDWTVVTKSATETRVNNTTLTDDAELTFSMAANTKYRIRAVLSATTDGATGAFQFKLNGPASPTIVNWMAHASTSSGAGGSVTSSSEDSYTAVTVSGIKSSERGVVVIDAIVHNGSNAGTCAIQWAQSASEAAVNCRVLAGSYIEYKAVP